MPKKFARKYVVEDTTDGVLRFYFRKKGQKKIRLPGVPGSDEFNQAYYDALEGNVKEEPAGPKLATKGTFRWLCQEYFQSAEYKQLDARTRLVRKQIVEHMWDEPIKPDSKRKFEDMPLSAFNARAVRTLRDRKADLPEAANSRVKTLRGIFTWATSPGAEHVLSNPARDVPLFKTGSEGFHTWTEAEVEQFEASHPIGTKGRLALGLMLYTSQRRSDAIVLGRQHIQGASFKFTQFKGRNRKPVTLELPIHPELQTIIDGSPCGDLTFLVTAFNKPFTSAGFGNWFRKQCDNAGLKHCTAHGLRKVAATRMANNGATEKQIMSVTGHTTSKEVTRYTKAASQRRLAKSAIGLIRKVEDDE
ncbi:tyrosine-type recombinase/integrase [Rhizobium sp. P32RR-XVIII]|uniref:tyrosine-type recombinase/integrase n=1 Tax=Rhizobium sp. P32RR-XVIII TaxID=2726738 RepID=UPI001457353F|nr:tyrosine-type recombinase/integrase [Rhizobium sp. P32RR-XVIII]NLS02281.1 tyrosine-type recombinase/integrase [Rhizobium sp. P32RR-XVIII]